MSDIRVCLRCRGPMPAKLSGCPHCGAEQRSVKRFRDAMRLLGGVSVSMTLTACYGSAVGTPTWDPNGGSGGTNSGPTYPTCDELAPSLQTPDTDKDGYCGLSDCNENDPATNAAATDTPGDGIDQNCNGQDGRAPDAGAN